MAFLRKHHKGSRTYYSINFSIRIEGKPHPKQRQLVWLGNAEQAIQKLQAGIEQVSPIDCKRMLLKLQSNQLSSFD